MLHGWTASGVSYQFVLFPVVAALVGAWVADETLNASIAVGALIAIAGVYVGALSGGGRAPDCEVEDEVARKPSEADRR